MSSSNARRDALPEPPPAALLRAEAARRLGIRVEVLDPETGCLLELSDGRRRRVLVTGLSPLNDAGAARLAGDKFYAGEVLRRAGFRVPAGARCLQESAFETSSFPRLTGLAPGRQLARERGFPLVVKPNRGARGRDVALVQDLAELEAAVRRVWRREVLALVQERAEGFDLRLDFLDGELLLGYTRQPVVLEGNGEHTLAQLLATWDRRFSGPAFEQRLAEDPFWQHRVLERGLGVGYVLPAGESLALTDAILNLNRLCVARMLEGLPVVWLEHARAIGRALHLRHFGVDLKFPGEGGDLSADPAEAAILEVNASPSLGQTYLRGEVEVAVAAEMKVLEAILGTVRTFGVVLLVWVLALGLACSGPPKAAAPAPPSTEDSATDDPARAELAGICESLRDSEERFYGEKPRRELEGRLAGGGLDAEQSMVAHALLGKELVEMGRPLEAVAQLEEALELAGRQEVPGTFRAEVLGTLAAAHLQAAEDANCLEHPGHPQPPGADSCILPIRQSGIHSAPEHARRAGDLYLRFLEDVPGSAVAAWLLNLSRMVTGDYPQGVPERYRVAPDLFAEGEAGWGARWRDRARELGVASVDLAGGAVMDDFDGDGLLDLISSTADPCDSLKAFRNDGRGGFEDVTKPWGLDAQLGGLNLIHGDYDGDGRLDLLVLRGAWMFEQGRIRNSLLRNELGAGGKGRFRDVTREAGLGGEAQPTQTAAWADYDGDGHLDLYVGNEAQPPGMAASRLYRGDGRGRFEDVTAAAGVANHRFAKAVAWGDYDDDGDPDLYISNIGPNRLYRNDGDGTFTDVAPELGVTAPERKSFAAWFFDYDNDGDLDLFVADYNGPLSRVVEAYFRPRGPGASDLGGRPLVYRNDGGRFAEVSRSLGLVRPLLPMGANYGDLDNDGWLDIYLGTGDPEFESQIPNVVLRNREGRAFDDVTFPSGLGHLQKGHGVAFGDIDNDGDQDLWHQLGGFFPGDGYGNALFENPGSQAPSPARSWITLRLQGVQANRFGLGARIAVTVRTPTGRRTIHTLAGSGGSFGGSSLQQEIGLGDATAIEEITIRWPGSGTLDRIPGASLDRFYEIVEGRGRAQPLEVPRIRLGD